MNRGAVLPAPYIPDPERLVAHAHQWPHAAFIRTQDPASRGAISDIFFAGHTLVHEGIYYPHAPHAWQHDYAALTSKPAVAPIAGYYAYEFGFQFEPDRWSALPIAPGQPMFRFMELPYWYQADHETRTAHIHIAPGTDPQTCRNFQDYICEIQVRPPEQRPPAPPPLADTLIETCGELSAGEYTHAISAIMDDIHAGRYYELNFTQRFHKTSTAQPCTLFHQLAAHLKPAYAFYAQFDDEVIVSASPELFLHKHGTSIQTCPIKGSYRTSPTLPQLQKLMAEHIMVVDLARNDLGRVSDTGWVHVAEQAAALQYGQISHLESRITGHTSRSTPEILAATLPAASITGNPKVITVQSIAAHERSPRGIYTGNCGIHWPNGDFQLNVAIRTLRACRCPSASSEALQPSTEPWHYTLGAGGAITADSNPEEEYGECLTKIRPLLQHL